MNASPTRAVRRVLTAVRMGGRTYRRTPALLGLLVVLPAYVAGLFAVVAPETPVVLDLDGGSVRTSLDVVLPAFTTPMVAALVAGIAGLFLVQSTASADARLAIAGYRSVEIVAARVGLLTGVSALATAVAVGVSLVAFEPAHLGWYAVATALTALVYGAVGVVAGLVVDRLPGVYLILFGAMVDLFLFQNPLATDAPDFAAVLPGHYPLALAVDAGFADAVSLGPLWRALVVLGLLSALATLAFYRAVRA